MRILSSAEKCRRVARRIFFTTSDGGQVKMSDWVLHCAVNQRHIRRSQPTREAALKDACSQLLQGHAVNRIVGPNETITAERVRDWCAKHRPSPATQSPNFSL